jgi:hypothetical protein
MNKENVYTHNGVLFSNKEWNCVTCRKMDGTGDHHVKQSFLSCVESIPKRMMSWM